MCTASYCLQCKVRLGDSGARAKKTEDAPRQNAKYISPPDVSKRVPGVHRIIFFTRQSAPRRSEEKCGRDLGGSAICPTNVAAAKARAPVCPTMGGDVHRTILFTRQSVPRRSEGKCGRRLGDSGVRAKKKRTLHAKSPVGDSPPDLPDPAETVSGGASQDPTSSRAAGQDDGSSTRNSFK